LSKAREGRIAAVWGKRWQGRENKEGRKSERKRNVGGVKRRLSEFGKCGIGGRCGLPHKVEESSMPAKLDRDKKRLSLESTTKNAPESEQEAGQYPHRAEGAKSARKKDNHPKVTHGRQK